MTTKSFKRVGFCLILSICIIICTMCKKENDTEPSTFQRVTGYKGYLNDTLAVKNIITYSGNLITEIILYETGTTELLKTSLQYSGNLITSVTSYYRSEGTLIKYSYQEITGYAGVNPSGIILHAYNEAGAETSQYKTIYSYNGSILEKTEEYRYDNGTWAMDGTTSFVYDNLGRIMQEYDTNSYYGQVTTFSYDASHMIESLRQNYFYGVLTNDIKTTYEYSNGLLSRAATYHWDSGTWTEVEETAYAYNGNGNLEQQRRSYMGNYFTVSIDFMYGEGSGNYRQYEKIAGGALMLPGDPTPYPVKSSGPLSGYLFSQGFKHTGH